MLDDLRKLTDPWFVDDWPVQSCPSCWHGRLHVHGFLAPQESRESLYARNDEEWEDAWKHGVFTGTLRCSAKSCAESIVIAGEWTTGEPEQNKLAPRYLMRFAYPALPFFRVPDSTPTEVRVAIEKASSVVWTDPPASANRLRQAVERLLDRRGVRKWSVSRRPVQLQGRIAELRTRPQYAQVADLFDALRARGNVGSHGGGLDVVHVLEMAQVLGLALELLYDKADDETKALAGRMVRRRGKP